MEWVIVAGVVIVFLFGIAIGRMDAKMRYLARERFLYRCLSLERKAVLYWERLAKELQKGLR